MRELSADLQEVTPEIVEETEEITEEGVTIPQKNIDALAPEAITDTRTKDAETIGVPKIEETDVKRKAVVAETEDIGVKERSQRGIVDESTQHTDN